MMEGNTPVGIQNHLDKSGQPHCNHKLACATKKKDNSVRGKTTSALVSEDP